MVGAVWSRPAWGAWIEIIQPGQAMQLLGSRAPHGARGLKFILVQRVRIVTQVAPRMGRVD